MEKILLVEGNDDLHIFSSLFAKYKIPKTFDIEDKNGISNILSAIPLYIKAQQTHIGIVVDADEDINTRWLSIVNQLEPFGYNIPQKPSYQGSILKMEGFPKVGIWIMPNNQLSGMIEDFMAYLVPENDLLLEKAGAVLAELELQKINKYKAKHKSKAQIHTWLAWQEAPGTPMGAAITKKYFDPNNKEAKIFIKWIKDLFDIEK